MSHVATNWAIQQRGLKPATKIVLWHLADRHNPDFGCFPSQAQLAKDSEMSRSGLNNHLDELERQGLIRRERRIDPDTRKQQSTRYILGFEDDFTQDPCLRFGHGKSSGGHVDNMEKSRVQDEKAVSKSRVQNVDTNPVSIEPVITTAGARARAVDNSDAETQILAAAGPGLCPESRRSILSTTDVIDGWIADGFDLQEDILPVVRSRTERPRGSPIRTWSYFTQPIRTAYQARVSRAERPQSAENSTAPAAPVDSDQQADRPDDGEARLRFFAEWINSDRYLPPSAVTNTTIRALIARGLVTNERLLERGLPTIEGGNSR